MNDDEVPSSCARVGARVLGIAQLVLLGPVTIASTLASSLLCCGCIVLKFTTDANGFTWQGLQTFFSSCMSSWGIFWMLMLFFLPLALAAGSFVVAVGAAAVAITYPCYAVQR
jgi:ABC-type multidrug transport system permease subunit